MAAFLFAGCAGGAGPTPIIIYVTPPATIAPSVVAAVPATPVTTVEPAHEPTPTPKPTPTSKPTPKPTPVPTPRPWYPKGYTVILEDPPVAFRWLRTSEFDCSYTGASCWGMFVVPQLGCSSSLYVELSIQDSSGTVIGSTNDAVGYVGPGQRAKLVFDSFDNAADTARISRVSCY